MSGTCWQWVEQHQHVDKNIGTVRQHQHDDKPTGSGVERVEHINGSAEKQQHFGKLIHLVGQNQHNDKRGIQNYKQE